MSWEVILKVKSFNHTVLRMAIEEIISDKDNFDIYDLLGEVKEEYANKMHPIMGGQAKQHAERLTRQAVTKIIKQIGTHKLHRKRQYVEGKFVGQSSGTYRRVEE